MNSNLITYPKSAGGQGTITKVSRPWLNYIRSYWGGLYWLQLNTVLIRFFENLKQQKSWVKMFPKIFDVLLQFIGFYLNKGDLS